MSPKGKAVLVLSFGPGLLVAVVPERDTVGFGGYPETTAFHNWGVVDDQVLSTQSN